MGCTVYMGYVRMLTLTEYGLIYVNKKNWVHNIFMKRGSFMFAENPSQSLPNPENRKKNLR